MLCVSLLSESSIRLDEAPATDVGAPHLQSLQAHLAFSGDALRACAHLPAISGLTTPIPRPPPARAPLSPTRLAPSRMPTPVVMPSYASKGLLPMKESQP
jgi:hypothetical protein